MVNSTKYKDWNGWAYCVDRFIEVVKETEEMLIVPDGETIGPAQLVRENAASDRIDSISLINNHVDSDIHWTVY